jgi:hypothetical protein
MGEPSSALGITGWLAILVIGGIIIAPTGKGVRDTFFYKYRPANHPVLSPAVIGFFWVSALILLGVSWIYLLTTTSNNGKWCDHLFPNQAHPWDGMLSLYLVTAVFIKMWNPFVYWLDDQYVYWRGVDVSKAASVEMSAQGSAGSRVAARKSASASLGDDTPETFMAKQELYYVNGNLVRWGMALYSLALVALLVTIIAFYSNVYSGQKNDQRFKIIYWTVFVSFLVSIFGFIMTCISVFWYSDRESRAKFFDTPNAPALVRRNIENTQG